MTWLRCSAGDALCKRQGRCSVGPRDSGTSGFVPPHCLSRSVPWTGNHLNDWHLCPIPWSCGTPMVTSAVALSVHKPHGNLRITCCGCFESFLTSPGSCIAAVAVAVVAASTRRSRTAGWHGSSTAHGRARYKLLTSLLRVSDIQLDVWLAVPLVLRRRSLDP
eukprot:5010426-Amphidinium_carterae.1